SVSAAPPERMPLRRLQLAPAFFVWRCFHALVAKGLAPCFSSGAFPISFVGMLDRQAAYELVCQYTASDSLRKHMLAVEAAMRAYARRFDQDVEKWGIVGLLHDFDYERWPDPPDHPLRGAAILAELGYPDDVIYAIKSHADYLTDCPRLSLLDKSLYACDELAGFITAVALVRPERLAGLEARSVQKKLKQKGFAASINRDDIARGADDLGMPLGEHIDFVIAALQPVAASLGLGPAAA
ncbi:MAG: HD domain-containing protein, partial [Pirellulales bacterium]